MITGKGFYIWNLSRTEEGDIAKIRDMCLEANLSHVILKVADGPWLFNYNYIPKVAWAYQAYDPQRDPCIALVKELQRNGIKVFGWQYIYGRQAAWGSIYNPSAEAAVAVERIKTLGLDGFVVNAEVQLKGQPDAARRYMIDLRVGIGSSVPVAVSSYRFPVSYHLDFPWKEFLERCDFNMPQVYWMQAHNPSAQLERCVAEFDLLDIQRPIIPTGAAFREHGWEPTPTEVQAFMDTCDRLGLPAYNFWVWENAREKLPAVWEVIKNNSTGGANPPVDPPIDDEIIYQPGKTTARVLTNILNIRTGPGTNFPKAGSLVKGDLIGIEGLAGADVWLKIGENRFIAARYNNQLLAELILNTSGEGEV